MERPTTTSEKLCYALLIGLSLVVLGLLQVAPALLLDTALVYGAF